MAAFLILTLVAALFAGASAQIPFPYKKDTAVFNDIQIFQLALNLEYLEAEFYLKSVYGYGVDGINETLTGGGPNSIGGQKADLDPQTFQVAKEMALQEVGHIRIIREFLKDASIPRPVIDISEATWSKIFATASNGTITNFNPYTQGGLTWLLAAYALPYMGLTAYVGSVPNLKTVDGKALLGGVLGVEGGQDALIRTLLYTQRLVKVDGEKAEYFTGIISGLRNALDKVPFNIDENIYEDAVRGAEHSIMTNILSANADSLSFARSAFETILILYGTGSTGVPGGFFPKGILGDIGRYYLAHPQ